MPICAKIQFFFGWKRSSQFSKMRHFLVISNTVDRKISFPCWHMHYEDNNWVWPMRNIGLFYPFARDKYQRHESNFLTRWPSIRDVKCWSLLLHCRCYCHHCRCSTCWAFPGIIKDWFTWQMNWTCQWMMGNILLGNLNKSLVKSNLGRCNR